jgi:putative ABC transport system permease protein
MLMSILERTREIGIMKAVGGTRRHVAGIFLVEASGIGLLGGGAGIFGGWAMGLIGNAIATWYAHQRGMSREVAPFEVSLWLGAGALVFSVLVSIAAGLYPAWRAARLDPVVALRHE